MRVGIKVGPTNWLSRLSSRLFSPDCVEVWYRLDWHTKYLDLFRYLNTKKIPFGLHFWGILANNIQPNFAYPEERIKEPSIQLVKQTLDNANRVGASYVNIHPGGGIISKIDLDKQEFHQVNCPQTTQDKSLATLLTNLVTLKAYAKSKGILLLIETLPANESEHWRTPQGRLKCHKAYYINLNQMLQVARAGFDITNDFGHSFADNAGTSAQSLYNRLYKKTKQLAQFTRLIHINTVIKPFNGTDSHNGMQKADFKLGAAPTKQQLIKLLELFSCRDDVWVIPEPRSGFVLNSHIVRKWIDKIEENS
jgi:hypothetical protein